MVWWSIFIKKCKQTEKEMTELEKHIFDNVIINGQKLLDLVNSGRLVVVGHCRECDHHQPPLTAAVDGQIEEITSMRCSIMFGYVDPDGWCYKFMQNGESPFRKEAI